MNAMGDKHRDEVIRVLTAPPAPKEGRNRLVWVAIDLFYRHGINAIGLDRVISAAGVSKTTFYKHFESKDDLVVAALKARDEWEMQAWKEAARVIAGDRPRQQLLGLVDVLDVLFGAPAFQGCQFINAAAEFPNPNDPIHEAAADHKRANWRWVRDLAADAGAADPDQFADAYTVFFEGTLDITQDLFSGVNVSTKKTLSLLKCR